ncbi:hypothetical protein [Variovorax saccharolyticus]|uniref:hypothetical protein n=1 Tax=Variovorax saccharolyticus TaxID=3053516 RepID=UPI00257818DA|nr:hypothetical protein [Variovorax sp. J31P216]MDM0030490.1 hypothetical protein [Variovorax sp. J31P216]
MVTHSTEFFYSDQPRRRLAIYAFTATLLIPHFASAGGFHSYAPESQVGRTHLIEIAQGSQLSSHVSQLRSGGYEASGGRWVSFDRWYRTNFVDSRMTWITVTSDQLGVIWGFHTGERGEKYAIAPGIKLGILFQRQIARGDFSVAFTTIFGGWLKERPCLADYGDLVIAKSVNCRYAAGELRPEDTLAYLLRAPPTDRHQILIRYNKKF